MFETVYDFRYTFSYQINLQTAIISLPRIEVGKSYITLAINNVLVMSFTRDTRLNSLTMLSFGF